MGANEVEIIPPSSLLSEEAKRAFREVFRAWQDQWKNAESLELGGEGNLDQLAQMVAGWAKELDAIADTVLRYRPKPVSKSAKKRQRKARKAK